MKTLDELDALYAEMEDAARRATEGAGTLLHAQSAFHASTVAKEVFRSALSAAWPEVRERLRRAEADDGAGRIAAERRRQTEAEGWDAKHDDEHDDGALAIVAAALAVHHTDASVLDPHGIVDGSLDAWGLIAKHRNSTVRCLEIAGALIAAEIDRELRRAALTEEPPR